MNAKWTWVIGVVTIVGVALGVIIPLATIPDIQVSTLVIGISIGLGVGAVVCVLVWFRKPRPVKPKPETPAERVERLKDEIRALVFAELKAEGQIRKHEAHAREAASTNWIEIAQDSLSEMKQWTASKTNATEDLVRKRQEFTEAEEALLICAKGQK